MTPQEKFLARTMFKLKIHQASGFAYEALFAQVMQYARPGFLKIKPYGNQGDRGNNGYEKKYGRYFQVFAPEDPVASTSNAVKKIRTDFHDKLIPHWQSLCEIKEYYFAFNDKYHDATIEMEKILNEIQNHYKLVTACVYLANHLEDECLSLEQDKLLMIVGGIPYIEPCGQIEFSILKEVVDHILNTPPKLLNESNLKVPNIEDKISFNGLVDCGVWLKAKQLETWQIDDYFSRNSDYAKQELRNNLAGYYAESLVKFPDSALDSNKSIGDLRFAFILDKIAPHTDNHLYDRLQRDAALIIMAKYFETCDIFEEPK